MAALPKSHQGYWNIDIFEFCMTELENQNLKGVLLVLAEEQDLAGL